MLIKIANNGVALPSDLNTDLVLEYGYTTALNQQGHAGIGGGEMAEIMHKFGGDIRVISTPD
jgi:signal transduction histidine kinase